MALPESLDQKLYHAEIHYQALSAAVNAYLNDSPAGLVEQPDSTPEMTHHRVQGIKKVPGQAGLILGDCIQNLRSTLDYLVAELALANGTIPNRKHMFPIAMNVEQHRNDFKGEKLRGINPVAVGLIEAIQPCWMTEPKDSPLYVIDELTNLNKHRRPIVTGIQGTTAPPIGNMPHIVGIVRGADKPGSPVTEHVFRLWVGLAEEPAMNAEVVTLVEILTAHLRNVILPLFEQFLK